MRLLLVDADAGDLALSRSALQALGHVVVSADGAAAAMAAFRQTRPDVVLTEADLPDGDGFALTTALQTMVAPRWQPVLFLTAAADNDVRARALLCGADACLEKPLNKRLLDARLHAVARLIALQRQAEERAEALERYRTLEEEERRIARHLIERLVSSTKLADPALKSWLLPASDFSGDIIAAARTPANVLHVMLADGTGHGLAASINVLPITPPFYSMTEKGFGIDTIARELNAKVRQFLPGDRFVAVTLMSVDFREGLVQVWNGGNPRPVLLDAGGGPAHVFRKGHLPLGIVDDAEFNAGLESIGLADGTQLVCYSDGLLETRDAEGQFRGEPGIQSILGAVEAFGRFGHLQRVVTAGLAGSSPRDDISFVLIDCGREAAGTGSPALPVAPVLAPAAGIQSAGSWGFSLRLGAADLRRLDVVPLLLNLANQFEEARPLAGELFLILSEFFNNALDHGLLRLDSRLKSGPDGMGAYLEARAESLSALQAGEIEIRVDMAESPAGPQLRIRCRDTGPGFDHASRIAAGDLGDGESPSELQFGRGLALVGNMCREVRFNPAGNEVDAVLVLNRSA